MKQDNPIMNRTRVSTNCYVYYGAGKIAGPYIYIYIYLKAHIQKSGYGSVYIFLCDCLDLRSSGMGCGQENHLNRDTMHEASLTMIVIQCAMPCGAIIPEGN